MITKLKHIIEMVVWKKQILFNQTEINRCTKHLQLWLLLRQRNRKSKKGRVRFKTLPVHLLISRHLAILHRSTKIMGHERVGLLTRKKELTRNLC
jgi:hypothetical protein